MQQTQSTILLSEPAVQAEIKIPGNIKAFHLPEWVQEKSKEIDLIRLFVQTGDHAIINKLKKEQALFGDFEDHNIIVTVGRGVLARRLANDITYSGAINYGALGTGVSPSPTNASTQLATESYRKLCSSSSFSGAAVTADFFYAAADCNGTYTEFGNFIDGTGSANTGQMFSYIATGGWVKSAIASLFVSCQYTIS